MKKVGILNHDLSALIAATGHGDYITVADAGLPLPTTIPRLDFCLRQGLVSMTDMLTTIKSELSIEALILAEEIKEKSPEQLSLYRELFPDIPFTFVPHSEFKERTKQSRATIRTGEFVSYSSVILIGGVIY